MPPKTSVRTWLSLGMRILARYVRSEVDDFEVKYSLETGTSSYIVHNRRDLALTFETIDERRRTVASLMSHN